METKEIIEGNELIAMFEGYECYERHGYRNYIFEDANHRTHIDLHYHHSWDWLMPVVAKCNSINSKELRLWIGHRNMYGADIGIVWEAVIEFIKWYNEQKQNES